MVRNAAEDLKVKRLTLGRYVEKVKAEEVPQDRLNFKPQYNARQGRYCPTLLTSLHIHEEQVAAAACCLMH